MCIAKYYLMVLLFLLIHLFQQAGYSCTGRSQIIQRSDSFPIRLLYWCLAQIYHNP